MMKYATLNPIAKIGLDNFTPQFEKCEDVKDADVILVRSAKMHEMEIADTTLAVARAGIGVNNIPLDDYAKRGIVVFNTPGANANGVKELVLTSMLLASRDIVGGIEWVKANADDPEIDNLVEKNKKQFAGNEIKGKKLGIIGLGAIGQLVANAAEGLGMDVYGYDPYLSVDAAWNLSRLAHHVYDIKDIYRNCDFITIHVPLMDATRKMVDKEAISLMKEGVVVLNLARDQIVDEEAMVEALNEGKVKKYVTDFPNTTTAGAKNAIVIPHLGASTEESEDNCAVMAVKELVDYVENGNIKNSVNYPTCDLGICNSEGRIAILHSNTVNMLSQFTKVIGDAGISIDNLTNKGKGDYAYTLIDISGPATDAVINDLAAIEGVTKVRVVK
ncbi:MAG: 3-phosphoglycerate dehydrogenase [Lachnospiraceae bacterium]|nr:3-phosphoglycerate dehydrogenase [Lachnospiraceae bacterium]